MTIKEYIQKKEDLEVELMNIINDRIKNFQYETGTRIYDMEVVLLDSEWDGSRSNMDARFPEKISDVNIMALR